jgi:hypothetical protein
MILQTSSVLECMSSLKESLGMLISDNLTHLVTRGLDNLKGSAFIHATIFNMNFHISKLDMLYHLQSR